MFKFCPVIQYFSLGIACICALIFTVLHESEIGKSYSALFLGFTFGWLSIFMLFICTEKCIQFEEEL